MFSYIFNLSFRTKNSIFFLKFLFLYIAIRITFCALAMIVRVELFSIKMINEDQLLVNTQIKWISHHNIIIASVQLSLDNIKQRFPF